jgi:WD40 repeat protein
VAISPDGLWLAAAGDIGSGLIQLWKRPAADGDFSPKKPLNGHRAGVLCLAFGPGSNELLSGSRDETARRWNVQAGGELEVFRGHFGPVWGVAYSSAGSEAATAGEDATVRVWTCGSTAKPRIYRGHAGPVYAVAFAPVGGLAASGGRDRTVHVWNPATVQPFDFAAVERELAQELRGVAAQQARQTRHVPLVSLAGHGAEVRALAFAADGARLVSGAHDNTVRLWRFRLPVDDPNYVTTLRGHGGWVRGCLLSPDERLAVSGGHDEQVKLWDIDAYEEVRPLRGHDDAILWAAFSRDGRRIVTASRDRRAMLWSRDGKTPPVPLIEEGPAPGAAAPGVRLQEGHEFLATTALFFPGGDRRLLTAAGDNTVRVWDKLTGGQIRRLDGTGTISVAAIAGDGKWILTGSDGKDALLWQADDASAPPARLAGNLAEVSAADFSPAASLAQQRIATGDVAGTIRLWRYDAAGQRWTSYAHLRGHEQGYSIVAVRFTPDGQRIVSACQDHTVMIWDAAQGTRITGSVLRHPDAVRAMDLSVDGARAVTLCSLGGDACRIFLWDLARGTEQHCDVSLPGETIASVVFSHDQGSAILTSSSGNASRVWRWNLGSPSLEPLWPNNRIRGIVWAAVPSADGTHLLAVGGSQARLLNAASGEQERTYSPHGAVTSANFSPGGERVVTSSIDGDVKIWVADAADPEYGRVAVKIPRAHAVNGVPYGVNFASFSPRGADDGGLLVATAGDDGAARLWRVAGGEATLLRTLSGHEGRVRSAVFSPDGMSVLTASDDGTARLWPVAVEDGADNSVQFGHPAAVLYADFSPDGTRIITGCDDNIARVWDPKSGREPLVQLEGHTAAVTSAAISADGRRAASGSQDGVARIWDLEAKKEVLTLKRHGAEVTSVHFSPDGGSVLTSSLDQTALVWTSVNISPSIKLSALKIAAPAGAAQGPIDPAAEVRDPDSPTLAGVTLAVECDLAGVSPVVLPASGLSVEGDQVLLAGVAGPPRPLATIDRQAPAGKLALVLAEGCTAADAQQLLRAIGWQSAGPLAGELVVRCQLAGGDEAAGNIAELRIAPAVGGK